VGLARQLALPGDVLLLDEPTNHLDLETARWLEPYLKGVPQTVILISHDRAFLASVVDHVLHVEAGTMIPYAGSYASFIEQREQKRLTQQRQFDKQSKVIAAQEDYIRRNLAGQNTKQAKGRRKLLARTPRLSPPPGAEDVMALRLESAHRGGDQVLVADRATLAVPVAPDATEEPALLADDRLEQRGPLKGGSLRLGDSISVSYYRQDLTQVPFGKTLYDVIQDLRPTWERRMVQGHLGRFGFSGDEVLRRAETLSGGERARVALAMMMLTRANLLILDEPTNHLDVESIEALEDALEAYDGSIILVSHDRALLRALATQVWALHDERVHVFEEPFDEWEVNGGEDQLASRAVTAASDAAQRQRLEAEQRTRQRETERQEREREAEKQARAAESEARRGVDRDQRRLTREAQRRLEKAERRMHELEARATALQAQLDDPALYGTPDGVKQGKALGAELDGVRAQLDAAMEEWAAAGEALEAAGGAVA
jgi:ATP-binding cassette subfamily F protein 3